MVVSGLGFKATVSGLVSGLWFRGLGLSSVPGICIAEFRNSGCGAKAWCLGGGLALNPQQV